MGLRCKGVCLRLCVVFGVLGLASQPLMAHALGRGGAGPVHRVFVDASAVPGGDGTAWHVAFQDLQDAIGHARTLGGAVELWVAEGVYTPDRSTGDRHARFVVSGFDAFALLGGFPSGGGTIEQRDPETFATVLSGDLLGDDEVVYEPIEFSDELVPTNLLTAGIRFEQREDNAYGVLDVLETPEGVLIDGVEIRGGHAHGLDTPDGRANAEGGGVRIEDARVVLRDCVIIGNYAGTFGGGVYAVGADAGLVLEHTQVEFNSSKERGGGVYTTCQEVQILAAEIRSNSSLDGGGQYSSNALIEISETLYEGNIATGEGGGMLAGAYGRVVATDTEFTANASLSWGGGLHVGRTSSLIGCAFEDNVATGRGGGLYLANVGIDPEWGEVRMSAFRRNAAAGHGGGAYIYGDVEVGGTLFEDNRSLSDGGGLLMTSGGVLEQSIVRSNTASGWGGGLNASTRVEVRGLLMELNHADNRGGAISASNRVILSDLEVVENTAVIAGGGVFLQSDCTLTRSAFRLNISNELGGGLAIVHENDLSLLVIDSNSAEMAGGGLYSYNTMNTLRQITCVQNDAQEFGGIGGVSPLEVRDSIIWGNSASSGTLEEAQINGTEHDIAGCLIGGLDRYDGNGNIDGDPLFVDPIGPDGLEGTGDENLRLSSVSPAIDAGSEAGISSNLGPFDYDGRDRFVGFGGNPLRVIDMGVYEAQDCDADSIADAQAIELGLTQDCNVDGVPDACQLDSYDFASHEALQRPDPAPGQRFGSTLATDTGVLAVGAPWDTERGIASGSVYLYDANTGNLLRKLTSDLVGESHEFGSALDVSGGIVAIGAPGDNTVGTRSGALYVFDVGSGEELTKIIPDDARLYDEFGYGVAAGDGYIAVGSSRGDLPSSGKVYVYDSINFGLLYEIGFPGAQRDDELGRVMVIDDGLLYIGYERDSTDEFYAGSVLVYRLSDGMLVYRIIPEQAAIHARFGAAIDVRDGLLAVGSYNLGQQGQSSGGVHIFDTGTGTQLHLIIPNDVATGDRFGYDVVIGDGFLASGAINGAGVYGAVYIHALPDAELLTKLANPAGMYYGGYGAALETVDGRVFVGDMAWRAETDEPGNVLTVSPAILDDDLDGVPDVCVCLADFNGDGQLNFFDVSLFVVAFASSDPQADLNDDGQFNFFDVSAFLTAYGAGCP